MAETAFYINFLQGRRRGVYLPLEAGRTVFLGRDPNCDIVLTEADVSTHHMRLEVQKDGVRVTDLDSKNGVFVNGKRVKQTFLRPGDVVRVGASVTFRLESKQTHSRLIREAPDDATRFVHKVATQTVDLGRESADRLRRMVEISHLLHAETDPNRLLAHVLDVVVSIFRPDRAYVVTLAKNGALRPTVFRQPQHMAEQPISSTIIRHAMRERAAVLTEDAISDSRFRNGRSIIIGGIRAAMCVPLEVGGRVTGAIYLDSTGKPGKFSPQDLQVLNAIAKQAGIALQRAQLLAQLERAYLSTVRVMIATVEAKDEYTRGHSERVTAYCMRLADFIGVRGEKLKILRLAALLHDIGKIGIPDSVLKKPGRLTDEEFSIIKRHPDVGYRIIRNIDSESAEEVARIVRHHHERFDGKGYPDGVAGKKIHIFARVIAVCDTYDAMTSRRPYRDPLPEEVVIREMKKGAGTQFDPRIAELMVRLLQSGEIKPLP